jgi:metallophosphoesterase (TIGR00282 family)
VNGENVAGGNGIDIKSAKILIDSGVDMITAGNHIWHKKDIYQFLDESINIIRPANYPDSCPGKGYNILNIMGYKILFINLLGTVFMDSAIESPFITVQKIFNREKSNYDFAVIDIHAEATGEKIALAKYIDNDNPEFKASVIFGTHTHVQTADEQILKNGAGYITDLGMTGGADSILGIKNECVIQRFLTKMPTKFDTEENEIQLNGVIFTLNLQNFVCTDIKRMKY